MTDDVRNLIIVGSGPAGYTAAVYAARAELEPLVFEGSQFGGELMNTTDVENYPGFREGIMGPELMEQMRSQAERFGAELRAEDVEAMQLTGDIKTVTVNGVEYRAKAVVLAMGAAPRYVGVPGEEEFLGRGVSSCATCDGFFFREQDIAVVGGGDSAMEEATFLTRFASSVTVVHRRDEFRSSKIMLERARANEKIKWRTNAVVDEVVGDGTVSGLKVRDTFTGEVSDLPVNAMFVAIGHDPRSQLVRDQLEVDSEGYVQVRQPTTHTSVPGVFAAGDLVDKTYRQAVTAAGSGCSAAIDAERWLAERDAAEHADIAAEFVGGDGPATEAAMATPD
ncbi:thioredoxin-disulfide reductase [Allosaccharopolyspora coralli]|uniref:Thioredoxin reductase n=1 Tax=Allosaccharopolyspora coralli TaxID=2665642 RepID=A0A5Q3Q2A6_9PSEU|nr:thioredoxin-disulfide reductase [Allosaccharopolyspora coralli]QGK68691.1 thioredoxin-disulfide reductase [Allosaccharopolyspora coralli]